MAVQQARVVALQVTIEEPEHRLVRPLPVLLLAKAVSLVRETMDSTGYVIRSISPAGENDAREIVAVCMDGPME